MTAGRRGSRPKAERSSGGSPSRALDTGRPEARASPHAGQRESLFAILEAVEFLDRYCQCVGPCLVE